MPPQKIFIFTSILVYSECNFLNDIVDYMHRIVQVAILYTMVQNGSHPIYSSL